MIIRSICYFKTRGKRRATKGDKKTEYNDVKGMKGNRMVVSYKYQVVERSRLLIRMRSHYVCDFKCLYLVLNL